MLSVWISITVAAGKPNTDVVFFFYCAYKSQKNKSKFVK